MVLSHLLFSYDVYYLSTLAHKYLLSQCDITLNHTIARNSSSLE